MLLIQFEYKVKILNGLNGAVLTEFDLMHKFESICMWEYDFIDPIENSMNNALLGRITNFFFHK